MAASFTTSDLSRKSGDVIAEAMRGPVTITQRSKPRLVMMSVDDYNRLRQAADARMSYRFDDMPDELFDEFRSAVEEYEETSKPEVA